MQQFRSQSAGNCRIAAPVKPTSVPSDGSAWSSKGDGGDAVGVELGAGASFELGERLLARDPARYGRSDHRVERVARPRRSARPQRDLLAGEPVRVAGAVAALVVVAHRRAATGVEATRARASARRSPGGPHARPLLVGQRAGLAAARASGIADLADVVEQAGRAHSARARARAGRAVARPRRERGDLARVVAACRGPWRRPPGPTRGPSAPRLIQLERGPPSPRGGWTCPTTSGPRRRRGRRASPRRPGASASRPPRPLSASPPRWRRSDGGRPASGAAAGRHGGARPPPRPWPPSPRAAGSRTGRSRSARGSPTVPAWRGSRPPSAPASPARPPARAGPSSRPEAVQVEQDGRQRPRLPERAPALGGQPPGEAGAVAAVRERVPAHLVLQGAPALQPPDRHRHEGADRRQQRVGGPRRPPSARRRQHHRPGDVPDDDQRQHGRAVRAVEDLLADRGGLRHVGGTRDEGAGVGDLHHPLVDLRGGSPQRHPPAAELPEQRETDLRDQLPQRLACAGGRPRAAMRPSPTTVAGSPRRLRTSVDT